MAKKELNYTLSLKDLFSKGMKSAHDSTEKLDNRMTSLSNKSSLTGSILSANLMTGAIQRAGSAVYDLEVSSIKAYMKMETHEARMTTLLHDRKAALGTIKNIQLDAAKTPFDLDSLIQANSMIIGAGESAVSARKTTMDLGNAIAATGGGSDELSRMAVNLGQIRSIGKATAMDVRQFMFAGIPIYEMLSKSMHKNVKEIKDMDISYKDLAKALSEARKEGGMFYQGLENANKTLTGSVSNLGDAWDRLKVSIGNSQSGILKGTVNWANQMLNSMNAGIEGANNLEAALKAGGAKQFRNAASGNPLDIIGGLMDHKDKVKYGSLQKGLASEVEGAGDAASAKALEVSMRKRLMDITNKYQAGSMQGEDYLRQRALLREALGNTMSSQNQIAINNQKQKDDLAANKGAKGGGGSLGSSVDVYGARPQNLTINITKLIENFTISTTNIGESTQKVKENVSKALLEAVNDVNQMVK